MLTKSLEVLADFHGEDFTRKANLVKTNKRLHIANQPDNMNTPIKIPGTPLWVEANQSSRGVLWLINKTLSVLGDNETDFEAYW